MTDTLEADPRLAIGANDPPEEAKLSIADLVAQQPAIVLTDEAKRGELFAHIEREIAAFEPDVSTKKGRDAISSFAFKFTKTKTAIDSAGKTMNEAARAQINVVDAARRVTKQRLEELTDKARAPLTEWEQAELNRNNRADELIQRLNALAAVSAFDTSADVRKQGTEAYDMQLSAEVLGDRFDDVQRVKDETVASLKEALARILREEADKAELEKLRAEATERDRIEAERIAAEAKVNAKRDYARQTIEYIGEVGLGMIGGKTYPYVILIRELEEKIVATEDDFGDMAGDVERARVETLARVQEAAKAQAEKAERQAAEQAAEAARQEEARKAQAEAAQRQREHDEAIAAERRRAEHAEADAQAERDRIAAVEAERAAEEKRIADQKAADEANKALQRRLKTEAKEAIMSCGVSEDAAQKIVLAIRAKEIPHVEWKA